MLFNVDINIGLPQMGGWTDGNSSEFGSLAPNSSPAFTRITQPTWNQVRCLIYGSLGIAPTRNYNHFLKIGFVVSEGGFYSYYIHQGKKLDKESKIVRKKLSFMHTKRFNTFLKGECNSVSVQFHVYPYLSRIWLEVNL